MATPEMVSYPGQALRWRLPHRAFSGLMRLVCLLALFCGCRCSAIEQINVDVCVYGGTSGGVAAAVQAARMGKSVALVALNNHLGGMTTSGLGWTDIGHVGDDYIQGVSREFYTRIGQKYGTGTKITFEPHVAEAVYNEMAGQAGVAIYKDQYLVSVTQFGTELAAISMNNGNIFRAKEFIDATYTGDLMAAAGVTFTMGRESTNQYGESLNGIRAPNSDFTGLSLDPYVTPGLPSSGLLPFIQAGGPGTPGNADQRVQAYCYRLCLTTSSSNKLPIAAPPGYDPARFELLARYIQALQAQGTSVSLGTFLTIQNMPNNKTDINNAGALSIDFVGESASYAEADHATRAQIEKEHKEYMQGFMYFLATDSRVPSGVRSSMQSYGYAKDEFIDNGGWPYEFYVREARRMVSDYVMTQSNVFNQATIPDSIGMAGYFTDSHYCQRVLVNGSVRNEGSARGDITSPYPVSYRALIPRRGECANLLVPWSVSASHTAFSSMRMEPVFMILGQAAGTAACLAIDQGASVQDVDIAKLQAQLIADKQALGSISGPATVVDNSDAAKVGTNGSWSASTATAGFYGADYWHDGNTNKGSSSVTFTPTLPSGGVYSVFARWTAHVNRAGNVPIDIISPSGTNTVYVNQTQQGGQWVQLFTTNFNAGNSAKVRVRNTGTTGFVVADAVEFVPGPGGPQVSIWATDANASRRGPRKGSFTIARSGGTNAPLTVNLTFGGTAIAGRDFQSISSSVVFPSGVDTTNIGVVPVTSAEPLGTRTLTVQPAASPAYTAGNLASASIAIHDMPIFDWRLQHFGINATNSAIAGDGADPAHDGIPNLVKYALGLDPNQAASKPLICAMINSNGNFQASFIRRDPPPEDLVCAIESSDDLTNWCTNCAAIKQINFQTNGTAVVVCESGASAESKPRQYFRVKFSRN